MLYRATLVGIIAFWLLMEGMLIHTQYDAGEGEILPIPVEFVVRLMFRHEQADDLVPFSQNRRLDGYLHLQPKHLPHGEDGHSSSVDLMSGSGSFAISLPGTEIQRIAARGVVEVDAQHEVRRLEITASLHERKQTGPGLTLAIEGRPVADDWHYVLKQSDMTLKEERGTLAGLIAAADPHVPGLDLSAIGEIKRQQSSAPTFSAHRGKLRLNGETIDTFVVTVRHGDTLESTIHFNQLGQILAVRTFTGYDLHDEGFTP